MGLDVYVYASKKSFNLQDGQSIVDESVEIGYWRNAWWLYDMVKYLKEEENINGEYLRLNEYDIDYIECRAIEAMMNAGRIYDENDEDVFENYAVNNFFRFIGKARLALTQGYKLYFEGDY